MTLVLVVDDSAVDRRLAGGLLEKGSSLDLSYAEDGAAALASMAITAPDIVVTDMQMPRMDGLELVDNLRRDFPRIPVILMTAQGSEEIAVTALQRGAASYVPKSTLARDLLQTVMSVLSMARSDESYERMMRCLRECSWTFELENDYNLVGPLVHHLRRTVAGMGLCDATATVQIGVALEEALNNALYHGNLELTSEQLRDVGYDLMDDHVPNVVEQRRNQEPYRDRRIHVEAKITRKEAEFVIRDEGHGFDHAAIPAPDETITSAEGAGRGLTHMRLFMDEVTYNGPGNEVKLVTRPKNPHF